VQTETHLVGGLVKKEKMFKFKIDSALCEIIDADAGAALAAPTVTTTTLTVNDATNDVVDADQYTLNGSFCDAAKRVLCTNPNKNGPSREKSFLGLTGHFERSSAWTHLLGALAYVCWTVVRSVYFDTESLSGQLATFASAVLVVTFAVSTCYHIASSVERLAAVARVFDHGAVDIALMAAVVADTSLATNDFSSVPWQTKVDALGVAFFTISFFLYRRLMLPKNATMVRIDKEFACLGLFIRNTPTASTAPSGPRVMWRSSFFS